MQCSKCKNESVVWQGYSGQHLCRQHFILDLEAKAKRAIRAHQWLCHNDHIGVAITGESGGYALLIFLKKLTAKRRDIRLSAIVIDTGMSGSAPADAMQWAASEGIPCFSRSFKSAFGMTMEEIERQKGVAAREYHDVLSRALIRRIAHANGMTKIAYGKTADEMACSVLFHMMAGTVEQMIFPQDAAYGAVPEIFPFMQVPEEEIRAYAGIHGVPIPPVPEPSRNDTLSGEVKTMLAAYDRNHPATRFALVNLKENLIAAAGRHVQDLSKCPGCGQPCREGTCVDCRILDEFIQDAKT